MAKRIKLPRRVQITKRICRIFGTCESCGLEEFVVAESAVGLGYKIPFGREISPFMVHATFCSGCASERYRMYKPIVKMLKACYLRLGDVCCCQDEVLAENKSEVTDEFLLKWYEWEMKRAGDVAGRIEAQLFVGGPNGFVKTAKDGMKLWETRPEGETTREYLIRKQLLEDIDSGRLNLSTEGEEGGSAEG